MRELEELFAEDQPGWLLLFYTANDTPYGFILFPLKNCDPRLDGH